MSENTNVQVNDNPNETDEALVTAYQASQIVNELLKADGVYEDEETETPKEIAPQMLYGYIRSGRLPSVEVEVNGEMRKRIKLADLGAWYKDYRAGNVGRSGASTKSLADKVKASLK